MIFFRKPIIFLALVFMLIPGSGFAQYLFQVEPLFNYLGDPKRYEIGGTFTMPFADFNGVTTVLGPGKNFIGDTTAKRTQVGQGVGGFIGLSMPFKATGHISCWAVAVQLMGNMYTWSDLNQTTDVSGKYTLVKPSLNGSTLQIALPLGIDYKAGNDAILTKRLAFGTSLGAGVIPQFNMTSLTGVSGESSFYSFGCTPYVKAEGSVFIGMCVKVRVMYTMGDIRLIDVNHSISGLTDGPFRITSNGNLMVSLILMPFSVGWKETSWWNTYDTYNEHDRLN